MHKRMIWADIGMGLAVVGFIGIVVFFQDETFFAPLMIAYIVGVALFAFICEWVATTPEPASSAEPHDSGQAIAGVPLPH